MEKKGKPSATKYYIGFSHIGLKAIFENNRSFSCHSQSQNQASSKRRN